MDGVRFAAARHVAFQAIVLSILGVASTHLRGTEALGWLNAHTPYRRVDTHNGAQVAGVVGVTDVNYLARHAGFASRRLLHQLDYFGRHFKMRGFHTVFVDGIERVFDV